MHDYPFITKDLSKETYILYVRLYDWGIEHIIFLDLKDLIICCDKWLQVLVQMECSFKETL